MLSTKWGSVRIVSFATALLFSQRRTLHQAPCTSGFAAPVGLLHPWIGILENTPTWRGLVGLEYVKAHRMWHWPACAQQLGFATVHTMLLRMYGSSCQQVKVKGCRTEESGHGGRWSYCTTPPPTTAAPTPPPTLTVAFNATAGASLAAASPTATQPREGPAVDTTPAPTITPLSKATANPPADKKGGSDLGTASGPLMNKPGGSGQNKTLAGGGTVAGSGLDDGGASGGKIGAEDEAAGTADGADAAGTCKCRRPYGCCLSYVGFTLLPHTPSFTHARTHARTHTHARARALSLSLSLSLTLTDSR